MLKVLVAGGPVMIPIILCAVVATVIIVERLMFFASVRKSERDFFPKIKPSIDKGHYDEAIAICDTVETPVARLMKAGISYRSYSEVALKEAVMNQANREVPRLEKYLAILGTIASVATLLGLLGSITGIIRAFGVLGNMGIMGDPNRLASAISEVLVATAAGLIVAIPSVVFYNYFISVVNRIVVEMESSVSDLVILLSEEKKKHEVQA
jgi:biopolymer transport protein ExbB